MTLRRLAPVAAAAVLVLAGCGSGSDGSGDSSSSASGGSSSADSASGETQCPAEDGSSQRTTSFEQAPPMCIDTKKKYTATLETDAGEIEIGLDAKKAPKTVSNFVVLSRYHFYDGLTFHRVITNFMAQGGDPEGNGTGGPGYTFEDELPKRGAYKVGSVAMANSGPDTNGSQFFIITGQAGVALAPDYSLFGQVTDGQDVLQRIAEDGSDGEGAPEVEHTIEKVTIEQG